MVEIVESKNLFGRKYEKYYDGELIKSIQIVSFEEIVNDYKYILIIDTNGNVNFEAYEYINFYIGHDSYKNRELAKTAIKILFLFVELFDIIDYKFIECNNIPKLIRFIEGGNSIGPETKMKIDTTRTNKTINMYLSIYRKFFKFLGIKENPFKETTASKYTGMRETVLAHAGKKKNEKYSFNLRENKEKNIPPYISFQEYKKIIELLNKEESRFSLRNKLIIKLMYEEGLRISEVLGLTVEDLDFEFDKEEGMGRIILRNRVSDKQYQHCKNLMIPKTIEAYRSSNYIVKDYGYNYAIVSLETLNLIQEYLDSTMDVFIMSEKAIERIERRRADKVTQEFEMENNYYIFINKNYLPLTGSGWNEVVRQIFRKVGIEIDTKVKSSNLNHKFRHGCAMYMKKLGFTKLDIMNKLRQTNIQSVERYFRTSVCDDIKLAKEVRNKVNNMIGLDKYDY